MTLRVLLAGYGNRGKVWARVVAEQQGVTLAGIVDPDPRRTEAAREVHGTVPVYAALAHALSDTACAAVVLATPPDGHLDQARAVFAAGLPLLCEKPLALDLETAAEIVRLARVSRLPLSVGLNFRYLPVSIALRDLLASGRFGAPGFGCFAYLRNRDWWRPGMNTYPLRMAHPMMLEQSIHHLDLLRFCYAREVEAVSCRTWNPPWSVYEGDANVSCLLSMEGGLEVTYVGTWTGGWNELKFQWRTDCPDGVIVQSALFSDLGTAATGDTALTPVPLAPCEPFLDDTRALFAAFVAAITAGQSPPCDGADHLRTLALCLAAIESDQTGCRVDVRAFERRAGLLA